LDCDGIGGGTGREEAFTDDRFACPAPSDGPVAAVADAALALSGDLHPSAAREAILDATERLFAAEITCFYERSQDVGGLSLIASRGLSRPPPEALCFFPDDAPSLVAGSARMRRPALASADDGAVELLDCLELRSRGGLHWAVAMPLVAAGRLLGVVLHAARSPRRPPAEETALVHALSGLFSTALAAAVAATEARELRAQVERLQQAKEELEVAQNRLTEALAEARETAAALRLSEDGLVLAQKIARLGNWDWDVANDTLRWSEELYRMHGLPRGEGAPTTYESYLAVVHPDDRQSLQRAVERALHMGEPYSLDLRILHPDGKERILQTMADVIRAEDGTPIRMIGTVMDVTEQRHAEAALRMSEERMRLIAEHASDIIHRRRLGPDEGHDFMSASVLPLMGYPPESWYADPQFIMKVLHPDDVDRVQEFAKHVDEDGGRLLYRIFHKDGGIRWFEAHFAPQRDATGKSIYRVGISREVTAQKLAEQERERLLAQLAAERSWLKAVIERSPIAIVLFDTAGVQIAWNPRAEVLAGRALQPGQAHVVDLRLPEGQLLADHERPSMRALQGELTIARELLLGRPDGSVIPVLVSAGPILDDAGTLLGAVVICDDMTQIKQLERLKEEWTSVVAHDLRQPVGTILGYASLIEQKADAASPDKARAAHIVASALRLRRMISDLLDISQIDARRLVIDRRPIALPTLVQAIVERTVSDTKGHRIDVEISDELPVVHADAARIEQVLGNLLSNAAKYGDVGSPIRVTVERRDSDVEVSVENQGAGISSEDLPLLFERFFRGKAKAGRVHGLGLGLYIAKGLIEAHAGRIWVEAPVEGRTVFRFTLPLDR
jgi:PAS domain S-box-containing protein